MIGVPILFLVAVGFLYLFLFLAMPLLVLGRWLSRRLARRRSRPGAPQGPWALPVEVRRASAAAIRTRPVPPTVRTPTRPVRAGRVGKVVRVDVMAIGIEPGSDTPLMLLRERDGQARALPIRVGPDEARAIAIVLSGTEPPRPMSHDLMADLLRTLDSSLEQVTITGLEEDTFYAELSLARRDGASTLSSRPSDAVALALRTGSPLYVVDEVLDRAGVVIETTDEEDDKDADEAPDQAEVEAQAAEFRQFLEQVRPEDFGSGGD